MVDVRRLSVGEENEEITLALDQLAREGGAADDRRGAQG
jgi:hypothetical protein